MTQPLKNTLRILFFCSLVFLFVVHYESLLSNAFITHIVGTYSYAGVAIAAFLSGIAGLPVPIITFTPLFVDAGLALLPVICAVTIGLTFGDIITYFVGYWGRSVDMIHTHSITQRIRYHITRHPNRTRGLLFLWAIFIPLPNELVLVPLGLIGTRFTHIFLPLILGNFIFNLLAGYGITNLFVFFG